MWLHLRMPTAELKVMVKYYDRELRIGEISDFDGAHNGLQVENAGKVRPGALGYSPAAVCAGDASWSARGCPKT